MKKSILAAMAITTLLLNEAVAQSGRSEEALLQSLQSKRLGGNGTGASTVTVQEGEANTLLVQQVQTSVISNQVNVSQVGSYNNVSLLQNGSGIGTTVSQYGNGNSYEGSLLGNNLQSEVIQQGNSNTVNQQVRGDGLDYSLIQLGYSNTINQIETTPASKSYQVVQEGNNMNITIEQSRGFAPATVVNK
ncbi:hypothetical protein [Pontibacter korlensis]|nr:hypothetical protein [Pontibacter korlensis]